MWLCWILLAEMFLKQLELPWLTLQVWGVPTPPKPAPKVIAAAVVVSLGCSGYETMSLFTP